MDLGKIVSAEDMFSFIKITHTHTQTEGGGGGVQQVF